MESTTTPQRPTRFQIAISLVVFVLVMSAAFGVAQIQPWVNDMLQHDRFPQDDYQNPVKQPEFDELQDDAKAVGGAIEDYYYQYYTTIFTIWATLILLIPALCSFLLRHSIRSAQGYWVLFWTLSLVAYLIHILWAVLVAFDGDIYAIFTSKDRVAAPLLSTSIALWWSLDVGLLFFLKSEPKWIRVERWLIHIAVFAITVGAMVVPDASLHVRILGGLMVVCVFICGILALKGRRGSLSLT